MANWERGLLFVTIAIMAVVCLLVVKRESITCDEIAHITAGMSYLQRNDARMNTEHPPLMKILAAAPLVARGSTASYDDQSWDSLKEWGLGTTSFRRWGTSAANMLYLSRIPMILVTLFLGVTVFFMGRRLAGSRGAALSLLIYASSPFFLAYGPLVLTDIGVTLFALLTVWTFASLWKSPGLKNTIIFSLSLTGALLSKFSSGLLLPILVILAIWFAIRPLSQSYDFRPAARLSLVGVAFASAAVYISYAALFRKTDTAWLLSYRYTHSVHPIYAMHYVADLLRSHTWLGVLFSPVILYFLGVGETLHKLPRPSYLLGKIYEHGTRAYFPVLFGYKMTPAFLCLVLLLFCLTGRRLISDRSVGIIGNRDFVFHARALWVLFVIFSAAALLSPLNIGIRHLAIPIAALTIFVGIVIPLAGSMRFRSRFAVFVITAGALTANVFSAALAFPSYVSYFNTFAGRQPRYKIAVDSNLDWGQALVTLRDFMHDRGIGSIALDVAGSIPEMYVPQGADEFECEQGVPQDAEWAAVGASRLVERPDLSIDPEEPLGRCDYLFKYPHWAIAGGAVYVFQMHSAMIGRKELPPAEVRK